MLLAQSQRRAIADAAQAKRDSDKRPAPLKRTASDAPTQKRPKLSDTNEHQERAIIKAGDEYSSDVSGDGPSSLTAGINILPIRCADICDTEVAHQFSIAVGMSRSTCSGTTDISQEYYSQPPNSADGFWSHIPVTYITAPLACDENMIAYPGENPRCPISLDDIEPYGSMNSLVFKPDSGAYRYRVTQP